MSWLDSVEDEDEEEGENQIVVDENDADNPTNETDSTETPEASTAEKIDESVDEIDEPAEDESDGADVPSSEDIAESTGQDEEQIEKDSEAVNDEPDEPEVNITTGSERSSTTESTDDSEEESEVDTDGISLSEFAPNSTPIEEAQKKDYRWRIMVWSDPSGGKTHFAHSMPAPIVFIDTESKAYDISHKFDKEVVYYQPDDYDDAVDCLHEGIEALDAVRSQTGQVGTIVVDSMSIMWEWSQQKYVEKYYPGKDVSDVDFQSGLQGQSDWKEIKKLHNADFRQVMTDSPYNLCWTAMRQDDYEPVFDGDGEAGDKPGGEKNNDYKIDQVLRLKGGPDGKPRGYLQKPGFVRHEYTGLLYPDFHKHREIMTEIAEAEEGVDPEEQISIDVPYDIDLRVGGTN